MTNSRHVRIIAGAGSGKTRVLTTHIAYLIKEIGVPASRIIGFTFTNKAAQEMTNRLKTLLETDTVGAKLSTFHAFGARFLREDIGALDRGSGFIIYDEEDTKSLIRNICVERGHEKRGEISKGAIEFIGGSKELNYDAYSYKPRAFGLTYEKEFVEIWREYERRLISYNAVDFADLINLTIKILETKPMVKSKWQNRYDHILVDEFQDTNDIQYKLLKLLMRSDTSFYVVGDPDQTIYTWRGANEGIIMNLGIDFPDTETIVMEQNYRSSQPILDAANKLIKNNKNRVDKNLFTQQKDGEPVVVKFLGKDTDEVNWIFEQIQTMKLNNPEFSYRKVAILLRANYLTLPFERYFIHKNVNYVIFGGIRFYQRKEVKDALAYFRLLINDKDDISFERIINVPRRGMGDVAMGNLKTASKINEYSLLETLRYVEQIDLSSSTLAKLKGFISHVDIAKERLAEGKMSFDIIIRNYLKDVGYFDYIDDEKDEDKQESMMQNINYLIGDITEFIKTNPTANFNDYLENASLHSAQDEVEEGEYITLMTVHMAKGLEYDYVFVSNLNEGVFPNNRAITDSGHAGLEEERRLCYVAFTRAKKRLFVSANFGFNFAVGATGNPSRFIGEAGLKPPTYIKYQAIFGTPTRPRPIVDDNAVPFGQKEEHFDFAADFPFAVNDIIEHTTFGSGIVTAIFPTQTTIQVRFDSGEEKKLLANHKAITRKGN